MTRAEWILKLNADATVRWNGKEGPDALDACEEAASAADVDKVTEDGSCRIYRTPDNQTINLWIEGIQCERIEEGGFGFDDQIDWWLGD